MRSVVFCSQPSCSKPFGISRSLPARNLVLSGFALSVILLLGAGCATSVRQSTPPERRFTFQADTFAFANQLVWVYGYTPDGQWTSHSRVPPPDYSQHCFVLARSAAQFFHNARFAPNQARLDQEGYQKAIHAVAVSSLRQPLSESRKIVIPGYANLRQFSEENAALLKSGCGGAWHSYFQRGHWRMILPFGRQQQQQVAEHLFSLATRGIPAVVHIVRFPQLSINHAMIAFDATRFPNGIEFQVYDPNHPEKPTQLFYDDETQSFTLPVNDYFPGGRVDVYQVYHRWNY